MDCWQQYPPDDLFNLSWTGRTTLAAFDDITIDTTYFFLICFECTDLFVGSGNSQSRRWMAKPHSFECLFRQTLLHENILGDDGGRGIGDMALKVFLASVMRFFLLLRLHILGYDWTYHGFSFVR